MTRSISGESLMPNQSFKWIAGLGMAMIIGAFLVGFDANPAPQPQRVADLVARLAALEEENGAQQDELDALAARVDALEQVGVGASGAPILANDIEIPEEWDQDDSSDGNIRYWHDPKWELTSDEPGTMDLWLDENTAIFFTWDWASDLLVDLHDDEEFFDVFEHDLVRSDETVSMDVMDSGPVEFMGEDAHYWEINIISVDGYSSRLLTVFYPCSDRTSCNLVLARYSDGAAGDGGIGDFSLEDWEFVNTFAHGVKFLTAGKVTTSASANLRACPDTSCEIVGRLVRGEIVDLAAVSEDGFWYQLESGEWISSALVYGAPDDLPVVSDSEDI
jgi:hypothetical protein